MYDLIGDIHGHAAELTSLLELLGYDRHRGYYSHPVRKAVFVGDFIDRGPQIHDVLALVRPMVDQGSALAVMGNHEFNALCYHTPHPDRPGDFLRPHTDKNVHQHRPTLEQVSKVELKEYLGWFRSLPMWLDLEGLRVVHACWDDQQIAVISSAIDQHGGVTNEFLQEASTTRSPLHLAIEDVLKGKEIRLPDGMSYVDKDGHERHAMGIKWYESAAHKTYRSYALTADPDLPDDPIQESVARLATPSRRSACLLRTLLAEGGSPRCLGSKCGLPGLQCRQGRNVGRLSLGRRETTVVEQVRLGANSTQFTCAKLNQSIFRPPQRT